MNSPKSNHRRSESRSLFDRIDYLIEFVLLLAVVISPWIFGMVQPIGEFSLVMAIVVATLLWGLKVLLSWRIRIATCPITIVLGLIFLFGIVQITPLSNDVLSTVSNGTCKVYSAMLPAEREIVEEGETVTVPNTTGSTISLYPDATRRQLVRLLALIALFLVVRNNIANRDSLKRLCWVVFANGFALSLFGLVQFFYNAGQVIALLVDRI